MHISYAGFITRSLCEIYTYHIYGTNYSAFCFWISLGHVRKNYIPSILLLVFPDLLLFVVYTLFTNTIYTQLCALSSLFLSLFHPHVILTFIHITQRLYVAFVFIRSIYYAYTQTLYIDIYYCVPRVLSLRCMY